MYISVFSKLASQLNAKGLPQLIVIPVILAIQTLVSLISAKVLTRIFRLTKKPQANFVTAMAVFGNSNSLPLSLTVSLAHTIPGLHWDQVPGDNDNEVAARGILYLLVFSQLGQALRWSWGEKSLLKPLDKYSMAERTGIPGDQQETTPLMHGEDDDAEPGHSPAPTRSSTDGSSPAGSLTTAAGSGSSTPVNTMDGAREGLLKDDHSKIEQWLARARRSVLIKGRRTYASMPKPVKSLMHGLRMVVDRLLSILNPPLTAILISLIVALIPPLQAFFFTPRTFVNNSITYAISQLGNLAVPITLVVLGANLARNTLPDESAIDVGTKSEQRKMLYLSLVCRMVLPVLVLAPLLALAARYVPVSVLDDPIFVVVAFILAGAPSALQLSQICQINGVMVSTSATLLFHSYVIWVMPSTLILVLLALQVVKWATQADSGSGLDAA